MVWFIIKEDDLFIKWWLYLVITFRYIVCVEGDMYLETQVT